MKSMSDLRPAIIDFVWGIPRWLTVAMLISLCLPRTSPAQAADDEIGSYIAKLDNGQIEEVKKAMPDLISKYQNNGGVMYLQGRLATDGLEGVKYYQSVVDNFPQNKWADDALYRIYQYYYAMGLYRTAELKMQQLKKDYPNSPHAMGRAVTSLPKQDDETLTLPTKEPAFENIPQPTESKAETIAPAAKSPEPAGPYTLQVGAFSSAANAGKQKNFFEDLGYTVEIANKVRSGRSLYLVWVGSFKTAADAMRFGKEIKLKFRMDSIVVERY